MQAPQQPNQPPYHWKRALILGLGVGVGMLTGRTLEAALTPTLGAWEAFAVGLLAGVGVAVVVALVVGLVLPKFVR